MSEIAVNNSYGWPTFRAANFRALFASGPALGAGLRGIRKRPRLWHIYIQEARPVGCASWSEPFCTVLPKEMSDPIGGSREQLPAKPDGLPS
jgi:hypothetical protein